MWDSRFHVSTSQSNPQLHEYYRSYFDKPPHAKQEHILLANKVQDPYPNLRSSLDKFSHRLPIMDRNRKVIKELG